MVSIQKRQHSGGKRWAAYYFGFCIMLMVVATRTSPVAASSSSSGETTQQQEHYSYEPEQFVKSYQIFREGISEKTDCDSLDTCDNDNVNNRIPKQKNKNNRKKLIPAAIQLETKLSSPNLPPSQHARDFYDRAVHAVEEAVLKHGATLVLLQELFLGPYFCQSQDASLFALAEPDVTMDMDDITTTTTRDTNKNDDFSISKNDIIAKFQSLAKRLDVVLPISIFERKNNAYYNSIILIDADGTNLGTYRKSHIPDGTGYQEKFYFSPGDTGFRVFHTQVGVVGVGICWDQWFPEAARSMALLGADILLYPTAIGSEPQDESINSADHWQRVMMGHAAANMVPVVAANRYGTEILLDGETGLEKQRIKFYGRSFITDETGEIVREARGGGDGTTSSTNGVEIIVFEDGVDVEKNRATRAAWGLFRDRRPELYGTLKTKDGTMPMPVR